MILEPRSSLGIISCMLTWDGLDNYSSENCLTHKQKAVRKDMPHAVADTDVEERQALWLGVLPSHFPDIAVVRIAVG